MRSFLFLLLLCSAWVSNAQTAQLSGSIHNESGTGLSGLLVNAIGPEGVPFDIVFTAADGSYTFPALPSGVTYTIVPEKQADPATGLSVLDLMRLGRHLQNVELLSTPFALLAADLDNSGDLTATDLLAAYRLLLGLEAGSGEGSDWQFWRSDVAFDDPGAPWAGHTGGSPVIEITGNVNGFDFIGFLPGDVDGSAMP